MKTSNSVTRYELMERVMRRIKRKQQMLRKFILAFFTVSIFLDRKSSKFKAKTMMIEKDMAPIST
jgi:hypothetical protein